MDRYSIYVHIPFCKARCGYCAFSSCTDYRIADGYFDKLFEEIRAYADRRAPIYTVYVGGGTPSSVGCARLSRLFAELRSNFDLSRVEEITVECNPESVSAELLRTLKNCGVNRLSIGLQSVNDETLRRVGRIHRYADFLRALDLAVAEGFGNVNADLIVGLPESFADFRRSVEEVSHLPLQHVSVYALELHDGSPLKEICEKYQHCDDELVDMYDFACGALSKSGFRRYETSNFAQDGFACKHNLNYWQEGRYYAFGASASGFVGDARYTNIFDASDYASSPISSLRATAETISLCDQANEFVMLGLRLDEGISTAEFASRYSVDFFDFFENARRLADQGLLRSENGRVFVPPDKTYVVNSILCELLRFDE